jgi:hypothetical protein
MNCKTQIHQFYKDEKHILPMTKKKLWKLFIILVTIFYCNFVNKTRLVQPPA